MSPRSRPCIVSFESGMKSLCFPAVLASILFLASCTTGAREGAAKGAVVGGIASAAGSAVTAAIFGGNPAEAAARGAVYGGTAGAVAGGIQGASRDASTKKRQEADRAAELAALKERIGPDAFRGLGALAECRHEDAFSAAEIAKGAENPNFVVAGSWLEVLAYADLRREDEARVRFPDIVERDWNIDNEAQAEEKMREALGELMRVREEFGLPRVCG